MQLYTKLAVDIKTTSIISANQLSVLVLEVRVEERNLSIWF